MDIGTVATIVTIVVGFIAVGSVTLGSNRNLKAELKGDLAKLSTESKGDIRRVEASLADRFDRLENRIETLDERVYALTLYVAPQLAAAGAPGFVVPPASLATPPRRRRAARPTAPTTE